MNRGYQRGRELEAKLLRTRAQAEDLAIGGRGHGRAAVHEEGGTDRRDPPVSVPQREGGPDERDPLVSDHAQGEQRTRSVRVGRAGAGRPAGRFPATRCSVFLFSFYAVFELYLNLCNTSCVDPKIMEIFV